MIMFLLFACMQKPTAEERMKESWYTSCMQDNLVTDLRVPMYSRGCQDIIMMIDKVDPTFFDNSLNAKELITYNKKPKSE